jgi:cytochrome c oxidase subunit 2
MPISVRVVKEQTFTDWAAALKARDKKKAREIIRAIAVDLPDQTKIAGDARPMQ